MKTAKVFRNGRSQAVRLPKECQVEGKDVYVRKLDHIVILIPKKRGWEPLLDSLDKFSDDVFEDRNQPKKQQQRKW